MKFTAEVELNNCINFIGLTISQSANNNNGFCFNTSVYRKPAFTGLFTNFNSFTCVNYRLSVLCSLAFHALRLCSTCESFISELKTIKTFLLRNAYPSKIIDSVFRKTLAKLSNPCVKLGLKKASLYVGLIFSGKSSDSAPVTEIHC